ncbi:hypothetical protein C0389_04780 [bacterium]|nr:hypothetical protein [bacterium]
MDNVIFSYTAQEAMEDGSLFDVSDIAKEAGFNYPVRITAGVKDLITPSQESAQLGQSYEGRLWDVLTIARIAIKNSKEDYFTSFEVIFQDGPKNKKKQKMYAALDGTSGPAIHIILPSEY